VGAGVEVVDQGGGLLEPGEPGLDDAVEADPDQRRDGAPPWSSAASIFSVLPWYRGAFFGSGLIVVYRSRGIETRNA
jgi:hypothetical protein